MEVIDRFKYEMILSEIKAKSGTKKPLSTIINRIYTKSILHSEFKEGDSLVRALLLVIEAIDSSSAVRPVTEARKQSLIDKIENILKGKYTITIPLDEFFIRIQLLLKEEPSRLYLYSLKDFTNCAKILTQSPEKLPVRVSVFSIKELEVIKDPQLFLTMYLDSLNVSKEIFQYISSYGGSTTTVDELKHYNNTLTQYIQHKEKTNE